MEPEKRARLRELRHKLANLTDLERQQLTARGLIATVEGRTLSLHNTLLVHLQARTTPSVVGGYQQWRKAGKQVCKGEHGCTILFPVGPKAEDDGDVTHAEAFYMATVFDISQVTDREMDEHH